MSIRKEDKKLKIINEWCKGCAICVEYCPKKVLDMDGEKVTIVDLDKCIKCGLCELRCPDYAIYLEGSKDEK
ncbi:4Fe-4S dicluster domain-containing protein [Alkaliphilus hydrothermalis]|uniref:2-oxoglutarate ferredoxin oxidoreductase subunit delta n=1 Tax=Alkaliphilus hydrothermalis TaxID=1482730 RepID=A0ABS2NME5_9FIRM|nr:2-oxoglutarate ferredoxin oxidoreductase subunit delta [Alkaliphilus hydrothermalis]